MNLKGCFLTPLTCLFTYCQHNTEKKKIIFSILFYSVKKWNDLNFSAFIKKNGILSSLCRAKRGSPYFLVSMLFM